MINRYLRQLAVMLAAVLVLIGGCAAAESNGENISWNLSDGGHLTISGTGDMPSYESAEAYPWYSVSAQVQTLVIADGVTSVGDAAFEACTNLQNLMLADSVASVGSGAINCVNLQYVTILGADMPEMAEDAFAACSAVICCSTGSEAAVWAEQMNCQVLYLDEANEQSAVVVDVPEQCVMLPGQTIVMAANIIPPQENAEVIWQSSAPEVVVVEGNMLTAVAAGTAEVTASYGELSDVLLVTVRGEDASAEGGNALGDDASSLNGMMLSMFNELKNTAAQGGGMIVACEAHVPVAVAAVAATCTEAGVTEGSVCEVCGEVLTAQQIIEAPGHKEAIDAGVAATCTEAGLTEGAHCEVCGEIVTAQQIIEALGHTEVSEGAVEPTCTEGGMTAKTACSVCGEVLAEQQTIEATGHKEVTDAAVAATCTEAGLTEGAHCEACGEVLTAQQTIEALGHKEVTDAAVAATCTEAGLTEGAHCEVCGEVLMAQQIIEAPGHKEAIDAGVAATCTEAGLTEGAHCEVCGEIVTAQQIIEALGHTEVSEGAIEPTCTEGGMTAQTTCSVCGEVLAEQQSIEALGHSFVIDAAVEPACMLTGLTEGSHCENCGEVEKAQESIPALGHSVTVDSAVAPTCTETGLTDGVHCQVCGEVLMAQQTVEALGHKEVTDAAVEVTCSAEGLTEGAHCEVCGEVLMAQQTIEKLPHTEVTDAAVEATYLQEGMTEGVHCEVCGEVIVAQEIIPVIKLPKPVMGQPVIISSLEQKLVWEAVEGAQGYELWRSSTYDGEYIKIGETVGLELLDNTSLYGKSNYYKVRAFKVIDDQRAYGEFSDYRSCFGLATSGIASVDVINDGVRVSVAAVANATSYYIYRCEEENGLYERLGVTTLDEIDQTNNYIDLAVEDGKTYYYKARAFYISPDEITYVGSFSAAKSVVANCPHMPLPVLGPIEIISSLEMHLNWEMVEGAAGYELWRSNAPDGEYMMVGETTELTIADMACEFGKVNYYKLRAYVLQGEQRVYSDFSVYRSGFGLATPGISSVQGTKISVSPVANATGYYIYRCAEKDGLYERLGAITMENGNDSFVDMTAEANVTYFYKVRAYYVSPEGVTYVGQFSSAKSE